MLISTSIIRGQFLAGIGLACALCTNLIQAAEPLPATIEFNRDVRPILSDACFQCHGPDKAKRKGNLRLDVEEDAFAERGDTRAFVPGDPAKSEAHRRVTSDDESERMPPAKSGRKLTPRQIDILRLWIQQGAKWQKHWAFLPPQRPPVPVPSRPEWLRNPIDAFVLARLDQEGLKPAPEADRTTLLRRVTLDLTGLPPTPSEVDAFLADSSPDAYEKAVARLLASSRYGERMASRWLDAARYADTSGYQSDGERHMWRWRDWVIDAFNAGMPFDRFSVEQIAGDLLPHVTLEQKIATGFNRNHRGNAEGGIIPEEYAVEYVVDRVETTSTVWLGLTMGCVRCHDHKFDPWRQREFYQLFAFFNNVPEKGRAIKLGNSPPYIKAPTRHDQEQLANLDRKLAETERRWARMQPKANTAQQAWEKTVDPRRLEPWTVTRAQVFDRSFDGGSLDRGTDFDGARVLDAGNVGDFGFLDKFSLAAWVYPRGPKGGTILSRMTDAEHGDGYALVLVNGRVQLHLTKRWLDDALRVETEAVLEPDRWHHLTATYDGSRLASGVKLYLDGRRVKVRVILDELNQTFATKEPLRIGGGHGPEGRFHGAIDEVRVYRDVLGDDEAAILAVTEAVGDIAALPPANRTSAQALKLRACFLDRHAPMTIREAQRELLEARVRRDRFDESLPTVMVMEEMPTPRETHVLIRGEYDKRGEKVAPGMPAGLSSSTQGVDTSRSPNRLDLARWLVDPSNPLTARVAFNRLWQMLFGTGIVKTVDDFGSQGEWPSHPELLDWLATEYVRTGWDTKELLRLMVTSATYRQSSRTTRELVQRDPENRLLARGPRQRLSAEMIRDQALAASNLLVERLGGPSVRPYQPAGLWKELTGTEEYVQDHGDKLYRRSLYTFWKRTVAPPAMITFDAAGRETCVVRETRTNTPLQALTLMNDVTYVEAARVLAQRALTEGGSTSDDRLTFAFRLLTSRPPRPEELRVLREGLHHHLAGYREEPKDALRLVSAGESRRDEKLDVVELAAYTATAGLILNLDEAITKE